MFEFLFGFDHGEKEIARVTKEIINALWLFAETTLAFWNDAAGGVGALLGKLIISGNNRKDMLATAKSALARFKITGVMTTLPFHARLIGCEPFIKATAHTRWVEQEMLA